MADSVMAKIQSLAEEREQILAREGTQHAHAGDPQRLRQLDHELKVLWDLRRRELAGEEVDLQTDFYDRYDRYTDTDSPGA